MKFAPLHFFMSTSSRMCFQNLEEIKFLVLSTFQSTSYTWDGASLRVATCAWCSGGRPGQFPQSFPGVLMNRQPPVILFLTPGSTLEEVHSLDRVYEHGVSIYGHFFHHVLDRVEGSVCF